MSQRSESENKKEKGEGVKENKREICVCACVGGIFQITRPQYVYTQLGHAFSLRI